MRIDPSAIIAANALASRPAAGVNGIASDAVTARAATNRGAIVPWTR